ncbi:uncharacterized protein BO97DRAFT_164389 [Aspergillus homomorphus CBS 101889]|uniref:Uncharacterized protein n=1 Tax=Aspergillus homomorphus (strain CBS 101889) TaxID=1450537 RepID=A0A395HPR2_ASPHC|nr:hypothetical protein BO97DRAFT_164389 [Aspergillus homomorphus CBS 101889]RAL09479.1 hypothetical protein BO97DRAFT_164389 [Aspergillus homomorphus CBS 101889]
MGKENRPFRLGTQGGGLGFAFFASYTLEAYILHDRFCRKKFAWLHPYTYIDRISLDATSLSSAGLFVQSGGGGGEAITYSCTYKARIRICICLGFPHSLTDITSG